MISGYENEIHFHCHPWKDQHSVTCVTFQCDELPARIGSSPRPQLARQVHARPNCTQDGAEREGGALSERAVAYPVNGERG